MIPNKDKAQGYNVYFESSLQPSDYSKLLKSQLQLLLKSQNQKSPIRAYFGETYAQDDTAYLHNYIRHSSDVHVYVLVPGTCIYVTIMNILQSEKIAKKTYVVLLKEHLLKDEFAAIGDWSISEMEGLHQLKERLQEMGIIVITDPTKLASSIEFTVNSINQPLYRTPQDNAIRKAAEAGAKTILEGSN